MVGNLTLILGGVRSGKSTYAEQRARAHGGRVAYVATSIPFDDEMRARVATHRAQRPAHWQTIEAPTGVGSAVLAQADRPAIVLLDCITVLANNVILPLGDEPDYIEAQARMDAEIDDILAAIEATDARWLVVSNEVGMGIVPPYPLGRVYRDVLGRVNQRLAAAADEPLFIIAGLALPLHKPA